MRSVHLLRTRLQYPAATPRWLYPAPALIIGEHVLREKKKQIKGHKITHV